MIMTTKYVYIYVDFPKSRLLNRYMRKTIQNDGATRMTRYLKLVTVPADNVPVLIEMIR